MQTIKFGIIGAGLMGREFASAGARWAHLTGTLPRPEIAAVCDMNPAIFEWYRANFSGIGLYTANYRELLAQADLDAVYVAVPHNLHAEIYSAVIQAGKHLLGEKPFGIDLSANAKIMATLRANPGVLARCASEFPFFPAVQRLCAMLESGAFGRIIEVNAAFLHASDLDPEKPINWKRMVEINGEYGVMGDLGMHVCHVPFRAGWLPKNVRAILSDIVTERPDGKGGRVPCRTWDNATLLCETADAHGKIFPMTLKMQRIAPGEKNTWRIEVLGTRGCARFSTKNPKLLELLEYRGGEQVWQQVDMGYETAFPTITGGIFEFGFTDAIQQMWAAFMFELENKRPIKKFAGCVTPEETALSHKLFTAALQSQAEAKVVQVA